MIKMDEKYFDVSFEGIIRVKANSHTEAAKKAQVLLDTLSLSRSHVKRTSKVQKWVTDIVCG